MQLGKLRGEIENRHDAGYERGVHVDAHATPHPAIQTPLGIIAHDYRSGQPLVRIRPNRYLNIPHAHWQTNRLLAVCYAGPKRQLLESYHERESYHVTTSSAFSGAASIASRCQGFSSYS